VAQLPPSHASLLLDFSVSSSSAFHFDAKISRVACESLQGDAGIALESSDQKTRGFVV
jgi:hypothetical protein